MDFLLKLITPKTPQPISYTPSPMEMLEDEGLYQFLVHLWIKTMEIYMER